MTPDSALEIKGNLLTHPFAELLAEFAQERLTGSLRLSDKDKKSVVYIKSGVVVFAVSNALSSRLFNILLRREKLSKDDITKIPNFTNDFEFAAFLQDKGFLSKIECERLFTEQITEIIVDLFSWRTGDWSFTSLARIRDGLAYLIDIRRLLLDYGRCLTSDEMLGRFRSFDEEFSRSPLSETALDLKQDEAFVLSRSNEGALTASGIVSVAAMPEAKALHLIYVLWLGGLLVRKDWQPAIPVNVANAMKQAKLEIRSEAKIANSPSAPKTAEKPKAESVEPDTKPVEVVISLDEYLERVEGSQTHYDLLGVDPKADVDELKRAYFTLARNFHPDRYHSEGGAVLRRIQSAFTELAQAHETLKNAESREVYDYRMRKELADRESRSGSGGNASLQETQSAENFDHGFGLLMENRVDDALPFLARAAHFSPKVAKYRAYYGKALSFDEKQKHKAEGEMQAALRIDPNNPTYRILLAEFFIQINLLKRAEGELNRLLAIFPSNKDARALLDKLKSS